MAELCTCSAVQNRTPPFSVPQHDFEVFVPKWETVHTK